MAKRAAGNRPTSPNQPKQFKDSSKGTANKGISDCTFVIVVWFRLLSVFVGNQIGLMIIITIAMDNEIDDCLFESLGHGIDSGVIA